ncbi:hypothetical protein EAI_13280 [Harpegnathos saltator]|uniref:Uncharacterized protein n=1 Tax=Harpegnathos saltator TaxID=610380 RepID=E2C4X1_HARSA|nr:hypothetical protein EAI_13280 [Harpegnathos saltator]
MPYDFLDQEFQPYTYTCKVKNRISGSSSNDKASPPPTCLNLPTISWQRLNASIGQHYAPPAVAKMLSVDPDILDESLPEELVPKHLTHLFANFL